jgi:hypothetical protein
MIVICNSPVALLLYEINHHMIPHVCSLTLSANTICYNGSKGEHMAHTDKTKVVTTDGPLGFVFFVAFIGATVYFVNQSHGFWGFIVAILKACVWPAYVVYEVLKALHV